MRRSTEKIISILLVICISLACGLSGCSKGKSDKDKITETVNTQEEEKTEASAPKEKSKLDIAFSRNSGVYKKEFDLEITCKGAKEIYYTMDGSDPTISSTRITYRKPVKITDRSGDDNYVAAVDPFLFDAANVEVNSSRNGFVSTIDSKPANDAVDKCTVIRAAAVDEKGLYTQAATSTYFIGSMAEHIQGIKKSCAAAGRKLAVISLSINYDDLFDSGTGIYVKGYTYERSLRDYVASGEKMTADTSRRLEANYTQSGKKWERMAHMDYFESDGTDTECKLQQDCGVRIQGNYSRSDLQKGLRLYAGKNYGKKNFTYAFFQDDLKDDAGKTITRFKTLTLRAGGNCAFTTKYSDTYWQSLIKDLKCDTQTSRPCIVYIDGEYWGLYVLQEDYSPDYFANSHGVNKKDVVLYKGDGEKYKLGYKLDLGSLPDGVSEESYYFKDLTNFFRAHKNLSDPEDYTEFSKLVDIESARDYFAAEIWINNKWDWPGKNWSMWKTVNTDKTNPYADGRWRYCFYDVEFGGVSGASDAAVNTIRDDNYQKYGLLDKATNNPAVLVYVYLMTNDKFRTDFTSSLKALSNNNFRKDSALEALDVFNNTYSPLYDQFFARYPGAGSKENSIRGGYASYRCISDFLKLRADNIQPMLDYIEAFYKK